MNRHLEIFWIFLKLGLISFGGPAAHIGYFKNMFVDKLQWLDSQAYSRLIALSQFLPGPGSSQIGFAIGHRRGGLLGGIAAFIGFTLPSVVLIFFVATFNSANYLGADSADSLDSVINGVIYGLKLLAVVVVADATLSMFRSFCQERRSMALALFTAVALLIIPSLLTQLSALFLAALIGSFSYQTTELANQGQEIAPNSIKNISSLSNVAPLALFFLLLFGLPLLFSGAFWADIFTIFYQAGSFVFGGGHVVLPLLQESIGEAVSTDRFLLGYATAQAVPGPMFSFAAFLGAELAVDSPLLGALLATIAVFLPGFLLLLAVQDTWESLSVKPRVAGAAWGVNAAVVGLLFSALYQPVFISAVSTPVDMAWVLCGYFALRVVKVPIMLLVLGFIIIGALSTAI